MKRRVTLLWLLAALAAGWLAGGRHAPLRAARRSMLPETAVPLLEEASPLVVFSTVALGGFHGLIADMLWLRVARLQEQGDYFEIVQLADWITKLEPRFSDVWAFHAWNMAYNISVMFPEPADRWRWVQHGIRLLRDEGLRFNPADPRLYRELGWIYQHKIGRHWDDAHLYYKWRLAESIMATLGGGRLAADRLTDDAALRQRLHDEHGLDADTMLAVDRRYGPLDWRAPDTHAVYWAWRGLQVAPADGALDNERMIFQGLAQAFRQGHIVFDAARDMLLSSPNLDLYPAVQRAYLDALNRYDHDETVRAAYRNFLSDAMMLFFVYGRRSDAQAAYATLQTAFPEAPLDAPLETLITRGLLEEMEEISLRHAAAMIEGFFFQGVIYRALGDTPRAEAMDELARFLWQRATARFGGRDATALPPLSQLQRMALERARATHGVLFR
jgi:hypothetical protein